MYGFTGTRPDAVRTVVIACAKIASYDFALCGPVGLRQTVGAIHHAHEAGAAFFVVVAYMPGNGVLIKSSAHTGRHALGIVAMPAEQRYIPPKTVTHYEVARFIFRIAQIQRINAAFIIAVSLHARR